MTVISYPIPAFSNVPINAGYYQPSRFVISGISLGLTTAVTTSVNHNYVIGQLTRLIIPPSFGCIQLNESVGYVLSIPTPNQVVLNINSSINVDPFKSSGAITVAQILAVGDINQGYQNANGRTVLATNGNTNIGIPGNFTNISPF